MALSYLGYSTHKCNGYYKEDSEVLDQVEQLKRFEWYSERYNNHAKSQKLEKNLLNASGETITTLIDEFGLSWIGCQFYLNAVQQLLKNRQTLKYSYVFGYFRPMMMPFVNKSKNILE